MRETADRVRRFSFDGETHDVPIAELPPIGTNPLVSIVLTAYRRSEQLRRTMESLAGQTYENTELIVVEADSDEGSTKKVAADFGARYFRRKNISDRRTAVTNNIGIRNARGEIIVLQCAECRHQSNDTIERLVAPIIEDPTLSTFPMVIDLDKFGNGRGWKFHPATHPNCFITFCQAFSRAAIFAVGGFDERYVGWGYEDNDAAFRLQRSGVMCVSVPVVVAHQWHEPPPRTELSTCGEYYAARHAAIRNGAESFVANEGARWGDEDS